MCFFAEKNHIQVALTGLVFIQLSRCKVVFTCVHLYLLTANASEMGLANNPENSWKFSPSRIWTKIGMDMRIGPNDSCAKGFHHIRKGFRATVPQSPILDLALFRRPPSPGLLQHVLTNISPNTDLDKNWHGHLPLLPKSSPLLPKSSPPYPVHFWKILLSPVHFYLIQVHFYLSPVHF